MLLARAYGTGLQHSLKKGADLYATPGCGAAGVLLAEMTPPLKKAHKDAVRLKAVSLAVSIVTYRGSGAG